MKSTQQITKKKLDYKCVGLIPARKGSKGVQDKNITQLGSLNLIEIAISQGNMCKGIEKTFISTDSKEYEKFAVLKGGLSMGLRDKHLAGDSVKMIDVIVDFVQYFKNLETLVLLQPTSPIRRISDIEAMLKMCRRNKNNIASVAKIEEPNPFKMLRLEDNNFVKPLIERKDLSPETPRQELPKAYRLTGGVYCIDIQSTLKERKIVGKQTMGYSVEHQYVNIDSQDDIEYLKYLIETQKVTEEFMELIK